MQSVWLDSIKDRTYPANSPLQGDIKTDVLVIGGGLAGVLCARLLSEAGVSCVIAEAGRLGGGTTGHTTGKVTAQHGLIYDGLLKKSIETARLYYEINSKAIEKLGKLADAFPCHFERKTAYIYSQDDRAKLDRELDAYQILGIPCEFQEPPPLPFETKGAVGMKNQAQMNPMELILGLAQDLTIYENTFVEEVRGNIAATRDGSISAGSIILATHFPMVNIPGLYFMKLHQHRSYILALNKGPQLEGMYLDEQQDGYSFRNYGEMLLLGGGGHRTGKKGGGFTQLRSLASAAYPGSGESFAWAAQDCMTLDNIPYIGQHRSSAQNLYVATGFNKWGMTGSMSAALVLTELIVNGKSDYEEILSPSRSIIHPKLFSNTAVSAAGYLGFGKRCTHMGCALKWNAGEETWDCPCHGSRFEKDGSLLDNPAKRGLRRSVAGYDSNQRR